MPTRVSMLTTRGMRCDSDHAWDCVRGGWLQQVRDGICPAQDPCPMPCGQDEFVSGHSCFHCPDGKTRPAGDLRSGDDTECDELAGSHTVTEGIDLNDKTSASTSATELQLRHVPILAVVLQLLHMQR